MTTKAREALELAAKCIQEAIDQLPDEVPVVPERVEAWPENDEHLRGDFWRDRIGSVVAYRNSHWRLFNPATRAWDVLIYQDDLRWFAPFTRTTDPSQSRKIDQLPKVPERIGTWPEDDARLRGEFWEDFEGDVWSYREGEWHWYSRSDRVWQGFTVGSLSAFVPLTRTADPSKPRQFDSLADVPDNIERAKGKLDGCHVDVARSPLSASGWMRKYRNAFLPLWGELLPISVRGVIKVEEVIDHEQQEAVRAD